MINQEYCIGVDFGTDSVRSIIVNAYTGDEVASSVFYYPRWKDGLFCDPSLNQFRQHPLDYIEGLEQTIKKCLMQAGRVVQVNIKSISVDTTGSTPVTINEKGIPLALYPSFESDKDAMFILWKDHTAIKEAADINRHAAAFNTNYLQFVGGIYSSEWFWAKLLHVLRNNDRVRHACYSCVEHCDWIPFLLTGGNHASKIKRSICAAGHKALWSAQFGGLPPESFFVSLDPLLTGFASRFSKEVYTADQAAGRICREWAERLGLRADVLIGVGALDAHMGAVGGQIEPYYLSKVMGTSTCDMLVVPKDELKDRLVNGICGQVEGSILPGMIGLEAGQSAFGDTYSWFKNLLTWPLNNILPKTEGVDVETARVLISRIAEQILPELDRQASQLHPNDSNELAIDWFNGRRTPDANQLLTGAISGLTLGSDAARLYSSLVEATCFGARRIAERFTDEGITVKGLIGVGGIPRKSAFVMQMLSDIMNMPIRIHASEQTCALGAAMFAATVAGIYPNAQKAMAAMGQGFDKVYQPQYKFKEIYDRRFENYIKFGNYC